MSLDNYSSSLASTFMAANEMVGHYWRSYTGEWIKENSPGDAMAMGIATAMLDESWKKALSLRQPEARVAFEEAVARWTRVHIDAVLRCERGRS